MTRKLPPRPAKKPGGPNRRLQFYPEHAIYNEIERRAKAHGWGISREVSALVSLALERIEEADTAPGSPPGAPATLDTRAEEIMRTMGVGEATARRLAAREAADGAA